MATLTATATHLRRPGRGALVGLIVLLWLLAWALLGGRATLPLAPADVTGLHLWLNDVNEWIGANRDGSPVFVYFFEVIRTTVDALVNALRALIAQPAPGRPVPIIGWLGVVAVLTYVSWVFGNVRVAVLTAAGFTFLGLQGLWQESMETLALTTAAVLISLVLGVPLGIWAGLSDRFHRAVTPLLDFMQTLPTFVYLAPLTLFFLIGPASAVIATLIYAMPPAIRITAHGIRSVPATTVEASASLGTTRAQALRTVLLPMAKQTIVLGVNQTIMAALAMVTIAALIDAPGLGENVLKALQTLNVGAAFNAGLALVVMAIVLDRVTTAASLSATPAPLGAAQPWRTTWRGPLLVAGGVVTLGCVWLSRTYLWAAVFPSTVTIGGRTVEITIGDDIARLTTQASDGIQANLSGVTNGVRDFLTVWLLNPFESLLTQTPFWATVAMIVGVAAVLGGRAAALPAALCMALIIASGLWQASMQTLASTLVATAIVMVLAVVVGVWMGRSPRADRGVRPVLDAAQVMPPFVYLVPILALFGPTRFTAIFAAVVYAAPVAIKITTDGIRNVPLATVEAATSAGSSTWQTITKVQLPMAGTSLTLATNQGLIYVLSMVVVGGLVGAGALGYLVVAGFVQLQLFGKGLAAGVAIVLLGIMLDRISHAAASRAQRSAPSGRP